MSESGSRNGHHELETLRTLQRLPPEVLDGFAPSRPPEEVTQYVTEAPKTDLQWLLIDVLHQLRLRVHSERQSRDNNGRHNGRD